MEKAPPGGSANGACAWQTAGAGCCSRRSYSCPFIDQPEETQADADTSEELRLWAWQ